MVRLMKVSVVVEGEIYEGHIYHVHDIHVLT